MTASLTLAVLLSRRRRELIDAGQPVPDDPAELIDIRPDTSGVFPTADATLTGERTADGRPVVVLHRPSLVGPAGELPAWMTPLVRGVKGEAGAYLRAFLVVFQRTVVRAEDSADRACRPWREREWNGGTDPFAARLLAAVGPVADTSGVPREVFIRHAGLFLRPPTCEGLAVLLADVFGVPVAVRGGKRVRLIVGPLSFEQFKRLKPPSSPTLVEFVRLTRVYLGDAPRFSVELRLMAKEMPACVPSEAGVVGPRAGWGCWLTSGPERAGEGVVHLPTWLCRRLQRGTVS